MMSTKLPAWLEEELKDGDSKANPDVRSSDLAELSPGDVWIVRAFDKNEVLRRHVLVLDADPCGASIHVALMSNVIDFATDDDLVLDEERTHVPYNLMVQTRLLGRLRWGQAVERVGLIDDDLLDRILDFIWDDRPEELDALRGLPCPDRSAEPRLGFERAELNDLRILEGERGRQEGEFAVPQLVDANILNDLGRGVLDPSDFERWKSVTDGPAHFCHLVFRSAGGETGGPEPALQHLRETAQEHFGEIAQAACGWLAQSLTMDLLSGAVVDEPVAAYGDCNLESLVCRSEVFRQASAEISLSASGLGVDRLPVGPIGSLPHRELTLWRACDE